MPSLTEIGFGFIVIVVIIGFAANTLFGKLAASEDARRAGGTILGWLLKRRN